MCQSSSIENGLFKMQSVLKSHNTERSVLDNIIGNVSEGVKITQVKTEVSPIKDSPTNKSSVDKIEAQEDIHQNT